MEWTQLHGNNVVRRNLAYVAETNFGENSVAGAAGAPNPFGGSYIQGLRFSVFELLQDLRQHVTLARSPHEISTTYMYPNQR